MARESPLTFRCGDDQLCGILHEPEDPLPVGLIVVVGGPQYRVGSHRQFVLLARALADQRVPVLRFDYRGMGDSEGDPRTFEEIDDDIRAAIDALQACTGQTRFALWGLCDGATAASFYAHKDTRVTGLVLANPWVRSEAGLADAYLKKYYLARLLDRDLWTRILHGEFRWTSSISGLLENIRRARRRGEESGENAGEPVGAHTGQSAIPLGERMREALERFEGNVLFVLSGNDLTAAEFDGTVRRSGKWKRLLRRSRFSVERIADADHTFSATESRLSAEEATLAWLRMQ